MAKGHATWMRVKFGDIVHHVAERAEPSDEDNATYVGLEHMDHGSLTIRRWGSPTALVGTKLRMRKGDVLFARRNAYLRRVAIAPHDGLFSAHGMVLRPKPPLIFPEFLPFFMQADVFMERAEQISVGSLSPTINWSALREEEFSLPPLEEQRRISELARAISSTIFALDEAASTAATLYRSLSLELLRPKPTWSSAPLGQLTDPSAPICYGIVQLGEPRTEGVPVLRTQNLNGDYEDLYFASPDLDHAYRRSRVRGGDVLIAIQGASTGKIGVVPDGFGGNINRHLARVRFGSSIGSTFFLHLWKSPLFARYATSNTVGSTKPELTIGSLKALRVPCPSLEEQREISEALTAAAETERQLLARATSARAVLRRSIQLSLECS